MGLDMYLLRKKKEVCERENIGYWRKANHIHAWFVENVQDGEDECKPHVVTKEKIEELLNICNQVIEGSKLIEGEITNGYTLGPNGMIPNIDKGKIIEDDSIAKELLPTQDGFFFGSTDYNEWYLNDVNETKEILEKALSETDFDTHEIIYISSW